MFRLAVTATLLAALAACRISLEENENLQNSGFPRCDMNMVNPDCTGSDAHDDFAWIQQKIFTPNCASPICHGGSEQPDLSANNSYQAIFNAPSRLFPDRKLIVPNDIEASYLMFVIGNFSADMANPPGARLPDAGYMPQGSKLCCQKQGTLERWIMGGAQMDSE